MIVRNRKHANPRVICDAYGCFEVEALDVSTGPNSYQVAPNPKLRTWRSIGTFSQAQLHFCTEHAGVLLDVLLSHVELSAGAAEAMRALSVVAPHVDEKIERPAHRPADLGEGSR